MKNCTTSTTFMVVETFTDNLPSAAPGVFATHEAAEAFLRACTSHAMETQWRQGFTPSSEGDRLGAKVTVEEDGIGTVWAGRVIRTPSRVLD